MDSFRLRKVQVADLRIGMYVDRLDRPWTDTRFMYQGFVIKSEVILEELRRVCAHVYVDPDRYEEVRLEVWANGEHHPITEPVEREVLGAKVIHKEATRAVEAIFTQMLQGGRLDMELACRIVTPMLDSLMRNPNALIWLTRMKQHDTYLFSHALNSCIWGMAFARHIGLEREHIAEVGLGCMLFDVSKTRLPPAMLLKPGPLTPDESRLIREHANDSAAMLRGMDGITQDILDLVKFHHERFDGSGYAAGLQGRGIPVYAKIAGIVDTYDALVSFRPYAGERSPHEAIRYVSGLRGTLFQPEVIERFMHLVGAFPTGSVIELNTGAVGVVLAQNRQRLRPRVALVLDQDKRRLGAPAVVDMMYDQPWADSSQVWVDRCLPSGTFGVDPTQLGI